MDRRLRAAGSHAASVAAHPGLAASNLTGGFWGLPGTAEAAPQARDAATAGRLWRACEDATGVSTLAG